MKKLYVVGFGPGSMNGYTIELQGGTFEGK